MKKTSNIAIVLLILLATTAWPGWVNNGGSINRVELEHNAQAREYLVSVPKQHDGSVEVPLVLFLHGGGGNAQQASRMGMTPVSQRHGFIVVYPNAIDRHWNDGRNSEMFSEHDSKIDDAAFLVHLVADVSKRFRVDKNKVFTAGISNGGFMSQRLAAQHSEVFAGAASIVSQMVVPISRRFAPQHPVSVFFMNGTKDPLVPYDGGEVVVNLFPHLHRLFKGKQKNRGKVISTDQAVSFWRKRNGLDFRAPKTVRLPDTDKNDGSTIDSFLWENGERGTAVQLYRVNGGGHTVPGGRQYLPERVIGTVNKDIDGMEAIWQFFEKHGRRER